MKLNKKIKKLIIESMQDEIKENYPHAKRISIKSGFDRQEYQYGPNIVGIINNDDSWEYLGEEAYEEGIFGIPADDLVFVEGWGDCDKKIFLEMPEDFFIYDLGNLLGVEFIDAGALVAIYNIDVAEFMKN